MTLAPASSIAGTVRYQNGRPAAGVQVTGTARLAGASFPVSDTTDASGTYRLAPLVPGQIVVAASRTGEPVSVDANDRPGQKTVTLLQGTRRTGVDLVLPDGGLAISGVVLDAADKPVLGATVIALVLDAGEIYQGSRTGERAVSAVDGTFRIDDLNRMPYVLWASHASHPDLRVGPAAQARWFW